MPPVHLDHRVGGSQPRQPEEIHTSREGHLRKMLGENGLCCSRNPRKIWLGLEVRRHERGLLLDILALCDMFSCLKVQLYSLSFVPSSPCLFFLNSVHSFSSPNSSDRKSLAFSWYLKILHVINANRAATSKGSM